MTAFSRENSIKNAIKIKVRRAKCMSHNPTKEWKLLHPDWCRDANTKNYTMLVKKVTEDCQKKQSDTRLFLSKLHEVKHVG